MTTRPCPARDERVEPAVGLNNIKRENNGGEKY
jgi:hypothetical protein